MTGGLAFVTAQQPKLDQQHDTRRAAAVAILTLLKGSRGFILALPSRYTASALHILEEIAQALYHLILIDKNVCFLRFFHISTLADFCLKCTLYNLGKFFLLFFPLLSTTSAIGEARTTLPVLTCPVTWFARIERGYPSVYSPRALNLMATPFRIFRPAHSS